MKKPDNGIMDFLIEHFQVTDSEWNKTIDFNYIKALNKALHTAIESGVVISLKKEG